MAKLKWTRPLGRNEPWRYDYECDRVGVITFWAGNKRERFIAAMLHSRSGRWDLKDWQLAELFGRAYFNASQPYMRLKEAKHFAEKRVAETIAEWNAAFARRAIEEKSDADSG